MNSHSNSWGKKVSADLQWGLKHDPYCCADNMDRKEIDDVIFEINNFMSLGGRTIVDATGSESIGRDVLSLREVALKTGLNIRSFIRTLSGEV
jgi:phosphotriesterase-related protein